MLIKRLILAFVLAFVPLSGLASSSGTHPVSPENGLKMLAEGNLRFALGQSTHPNTSFSRRLLTTTEGQAPYATIIACSDSRVPVEILFDQGVGDLFVIKVAGNVADTDEIGSAEYGVDHLGTPVLMVLGHTYCGAVTAVTTGAEVHGSIPELVDNIVPAVEKARHDHPDADTPELIVKAIEANIWLAIEDMLTKSHAIADRAKDGRVVVVGAVYDILTGKVEVLGTHPDQSKILGVPAPATHAEPATHEEPAKDAHAAPAEADHAKADAEKAPAEGHTEAAQASESGGGFGFFSFIAFVLLLIGAVVVLDKTILNPDKN
jgi:carbonic anhydrase